MKKMLVILCAITAAIVFAGSAFAQPGKPDMKPMPKDGMDMSKMHADGHHALMMAYQQNALAFTRVLWEMSSSGSIENIDLARGAYAEIARSMDKMGEIEKMHMSMMDKMDPAMMEKMKPMMDKMQAEKVMLMMHVKALGNALQQPSPSAPEVEAHSAAILLRLEKITMPERKMTM